VLKATAPLSLIRANVVFAGRNSWEDEAEDLQYKRLTQEEAAALRSRNPSLSPWRVVAAQCCLGVSIAALAWGITGSRATLYSALYGALVAVLPAALLARGTTSRLSRLSPMTSAVIVLIWAPVKMGASVLMLLLAPTIVESLSWPALLIALVGCMQVYWLALLWRGH
jgi:ATP synthase protein I